ncbi:hypothetical protein MASR2M18_15240 [Ignavibacteria bacterium]|nr:hypothetical protein [Bacteroidota bacterium]MCZ2132628.1 hypothetical protein [Bacteroidota bacterium]
MMNNVEAHPFAPFVPPNAIILIVGSFAGRETTRRVPDDKQWFYGTKRNQFWKILTDIYRIELPDREAKQNLFGKYGIGIADLFLRIKRKSASNSDDALVIVEYNDKIIAEILEKYNFDTIYFTSQFVGRHFAKLFPDVKNTDFLPSPSQRYARMSLSDKTAFYKAKLPH